MNRPTTYYVEIYRQNNEPHLRYHRGLLNRDHLSAATLAVLMVAGCCTQEEAAAKIMAAACYVAPNGSPKVPWNAIDNAIQRII